ncbi:MAG: hypothetical protein V3S66_02860, partial [Desulfobacterales bacterium]
AYPEDLLAKVRKAKETKGMRFLYIISPCPPGWGTSAQLSIKLARMAVQARVFPLYEIFNGGNPILNVEPDPIPLKEYIRLQGRFQYFADDQIEEMQAQVNRNWKKFK